MKLSELIATVGDEVVQFQMLDDAAITLDWTAKKGTTITFGTPMQLTPEGTERMGIVVWLPRDAVKAALASR